MVAEIKAAAKDGDSLGGVVEVLAYGVPVMASGATSTGTASSIPCWPRPSCRSRPSRAWRSVTASRSPVAGGARPTIRSHGMPTLAAYRRESALAGGVEGGISTGELLVARAAMKPLATLNKPTLKTVDTATKEATVSFKERTDVTAVPALGVVAETMVALVLAAEAARKFGGDSVEEIRRNRDAFVATLG